VTGEPVFKSLNYSAQLLRPGEATEPKRETAGTYYVVIEGTGATEVGGKRFEWGHNDLFVVPNFIWRRHINTGKTDAVIYSVSDAALMRNIASTTRRAKDGKVTELHRGAPGRRLQTGRAPGLFCSAMRPQLRSIARRKRRSLPMNDTAPCPALMGTACRRSPQ
jgi:hypothetical protein